MGIDGEVVFLGWSNCAARVLEKLFAQRLLAPSEKVRVITQVSPPQDPRIEHVRGDFGLESVLKGVQWQEVGVVVIFHEGGLAKSRSDADILNAVTALQIPRGPRVIVEMFNEGYAETLSKCISHDIELIYKERIDANFISHTIVTEGKTTRLLKELTDFDRNRIQAFGVSELFDVPVGTVGELRTRLSERDEPMVFLGILEGESKKPVVNPPPETELKPDQIVYCLCRASV